MIGYVTWDGAEQKYVLKTADGVVAVKSKNLGYIERVVRSGWDQATKHGITELQVVDPGWAAAATIEAAQPENVSDEPEQSYGIFNAVLNVNHIVKKLQVQPEGKRGRGRPRRPKNVNGITIHKEADEPSKYLEVTPIQHERLKREFSALTGSTQERVSQLAERHGLTYRQAHELVV